MKYFLFFNLFLFTFASLSYSQVKCIDKDLAKCEIDSSYQVFDYFNQSTETRFSDYGRIILIDFIPFELQEEEVLYITRKTTYWDSSGLLDIFLNDKLLFRYYTFNGEINGTGYIYYPKTGHVAYQGEFVDGKLNGLLFCLSGDDSQLIHSMLFKNGKPKKIVYLFNIIQTKKIYRAINKRKYFKKGVSTGVVGYPFE